ncbi:hypothetical protein Hokovirus_3_275 [Hokovirus HKV1]|uniref:Uncharacterized protein n=1 Tax=Hokovirus HKV1 TaxID=1977638 RepID=A0A1V0SH12_9VIRU|nr:hypothetical protein Hokovirus_3_275 [Hokovirus HKV1]
MEQNYCTKYRKYKTKYLIQTGGVNKAIMLNILHNGNNTNYHITICKVNNFQDNQHYLNVINDLIQMFSSLIENKQYTLVFSDWLGYNQQQQHGNSVLIKSYLANYLGLETFRLCVFNHIKTQIDCNNPIYDGLSIDTSRYNYIRQSKSNAKIYLPAGMSDMHIDIGGDLNNLSMFNINVNNWQGSQTTVTYKFQK